MSLCVISNPSAVTNESLIINSLFTNGLEILHLRKPSGSIDEVAELILRIDAKFHHRISLHQHHKLSEQFDITRFHFREESRKQIGEAELEKHHSKGKILSTSIHSMDEYKKLSSFFDYCFFGPVFNSISKKESKSILKNDFTIGEQTQIKIIALGGITNDSIPKVKKMGFNGIALLGSIWQSEKPLEEFNKIKESWLKNELVY
ncbi:MAG TPA: thiamine phosphate synthase [Bacteroidia bacterium]|nr:thiamine phosphate synthase [Bacteroidia bacterium]